VRTLVETKAEAAGSHIYTTFSRYFLGQSHFLLGEFSEALVHFEAALAIAEQPGNPFQPGMLLWTAETEARLGSHDGADAPLPLRAAHRKGRGARRTGLVPFSRRGSPNPWPSPYPVSSRCCPCWRTPDKAGTLSSWSVARSSLAF
jgi:hypothetical protein